MCTDSSRQRLENTCGQDGVAEEKEEKRALGQKEKKNLSRAWFRSTDLWVMGPARFRCATLLCLKMIKFLLYTLYELYNLEIYLFTIISIL